MNRALLALAILLVPQLLLACSANGSNAPITEEQVNHDLYGNFQTAVASDRNYDVYWMGRSFEAGGLTYKGPEASARAGTEGLGAGIGLNYADGLGLSYLPKLQLLQPRVDPIHRQAWDRFDPFSPLPGRQQKTVYVNGHAGVLWTRYDAPGIVGVQSIVIDYGKTVVEAVPSSVTPATPGPEPNPLIDEATFLAVMQNLRPYPQ